MLRQLRDFGATVPGAQTCESLEPSMRVVSIDIFVLVFHAANQVRLLARQHAFGGTSHYTPTTGEGEGEGEGLGWVTRHHAIDWNFVGTSRPRPNKWRIEPTGGGGIASGTTDEWLELSVADDEGGAPYYFERWSRYPGGSEDAGAPRGSLSLRACQGASEAAHSPPRDALIVVVGDHFNYVVARPVPWEVLPKYGRSLTEVVDTAIARGERGVAEACVLLEAGHGRVHPGWTVDASLQPWRVGKPLADVFGGDRVTTMPDVPSLAEVWSARGSFARVRIGRQVFRTLP